MLTFKEFIIKEETYYTASGISGEGTGDPDAANLESARHADNFHKYAFAKKVKKVDSEGEYDDYIMDAESKAKRDKFYAENGLRRMTISDAESNPHHMAEYLNIMHNNFPHISKEWNHSPITAKQNAIEDKRAIRTDYERKYPNPIVRAFAKAWDFIPKTKKQRRKESAKLAAALERIKSSEEMSKMEERYQKIVADKVRKWHSKNPDMHHLTAEQAHGTFVHDLAKDVSTSGIVRPPNLETFAKHWNTLKGTK